MTLTYGVTQWSAQNYVVEWYRDTWGPRGPLIGQTDKACLFLAKLILMEVRETCASAVVVMDWLRDVSSQVSKTGKLLEWVSPSGWPVVQHYRKGNYKTVNSFLAGAMRQMTVRASYGEPAARKHRNGVAPNFTHSIDSSVLSETVKGWKHPISTVHDSYSTNAPYVEELLNKLRESVVKVTLEADPLESFRQQVQKYSKLTIAPPPKFGEITPGEVLSSNYIYS